MQNSYLGMRLADAEQLLRERDIPYEVKESVPHWKKEPIEGDLRIIRVDGSEEEVNKLTLIVCRVSNTTRQL